MLDICPISGETAREERFNQWTHLVGVVLSVIGFPVLILLSMQNGDYWHVAGSAIFGLSLLMLYVASSIYHGCKTLHRKTAYRIFDHSCIYLLIAGTYTPLMMGPLREANGWSLLIIEWSIAAVGILLKIFAFDRFEKFSLLAYLLMGWMVVFSWQAALDTIPATSLSLIALGGAFYTLGTIFFVWESLPYNHSIWHLFVLGGSISHYFAIFLMLL